MGLSNLGIFHTLIGIVAIVAAILSFIRHAKIELKRITGKIYFYCTIVTSLTTLGISKLGGLNPGHAVSLVIVILVVTAFFLAHKKPGKNTSRYAENFLLSLSFLLSLIPTVVETFTRIPIGHPLAKNPADPLIGKTLLALFVLFVVGSVYQFIQQRNRNKSVSN
jgi:uncharacterized membrane protein